MLEQNQKDLTQNLNELEQPAVMPHEEVDEKIGIKIINDASDKKDLKDLEISFNFEKIELIKKLVLETQNNLRRISCLLGEDMPQIEEKIKKSFLESDIAASPHDHDMEAISKTTIQPEVVYGESGERIIEGVFNGQNMVGADGKEYPVPANYASKSKLVEGDILKLTINSQGNFVFKQIGPIKRVRVVGNLEQSEADNGFIVVAGRKRWRVLTASVTFFKGEPGDEAIILIPKNTPSKWAAIENVIKRVRE